MADQKTDDTTPPLARRGARPFAGPAGAPVGARPFTRPATTQRPTAAPFAPPVLPGKRTLGNAPPPDVRPAAPQAVPSAPIATHVVPSGTEETATPQPRPVTSEMVAVDAIDAFDAVWGTAEPSSGVIETAALASPSDAVSLGSEIDSHVLADEITTASDLPAAEPGAPAAPASTGSVESTPTGTMPTWLEDEVAPDAAPAPDREGADSATVAHHETSTPDAAWPTAAIEMGSVVGEWTDAHTIPSSDEIMGLAPESPAVTPVSPSLGDAPQAAAGWMSDEAHQAAGSEPRFELIEEPTADITEPKATAAPTVNAHEPSHARIAAALDRLAERVQSGEIDVSSIAPDATDAAMLASLLAALLGGSRRR